MSQALARVNLAAVQRNCARLRGELGEGVQLCAVVKADGYGHGLVQSARAALAGGAGWLAVASVEEAGELVEEAGELVEEVRAGEFAEGAQARLLVMGPIRSEDLEEAVSLNLDVVVWSDTYLRWVGELAAEIGRRGRVHVKLDSGMGRLGTRESEQASRIVAAASADPNIDLVGVMTHFATADELEEEFFAEQLARFERWARPIKQAHPQVLVHAANSAATLREPRAHFDMVRCGIAIYGMDPFGEDPLARGLEPALELSSYVAEVKLCAAGQSTGYGRTFRAERDTYLAVIPIGYGDGWRRGLSNNAEVLIDGRRRPLVGTISMDSLTVDLGPDPDAQSLRDREVVLIGARGAERITAEDVAKRLHTINYEITCGLTPRVERLYKLDDEHWID
ncbi:MAG TPA: alanine racemase [Solirubrobacteraceae bacterium]|jgi:alanine racemase